jgi:hypothetical protein
MKLSKWQKAGLIFFGSFGLQLMMARGRGGGRSKDYPTAGKRYKPGSPEQVQLFESAAAEVGLPQSWASESAFQTLLKKESGGMVGIPNYTYGSNIRKHPEKWPMIWEQLRAGIKTTKSSATGLGQMTLPNVDKHYPEQRHGIGDPRNEAIGMLRYIKKRYGSPEAALEFHIANGWY